MKLSDLGAARCEEAFRAWRAGSGALLPYVRSTPFVSLARFPGDLELPDPNSVPSLAATVPDLAPGEIPVVDFPGAVSLRTGLDLWAQRSLWPVTALSHWHHPHGAAGDAETASVLLLAAPAMGPAQGWSLLLDAGRYTEAPVTGDRFNNQYELTEDDLPSVEELRHLNITGVCFVTAGAPKDDLRRYGAYLAATGVAVRWHA